MREMVELADKSVKTATVTVFKNSRENINIVKIEVENINIVKVEVENIKMNQNF